MNLFTYGSLMFPSVWQGVTGISQLGAPAVLKHHAAMKIKNESYPALIPVPGRITAGVVYGELTSLVMARLDAFEGDFYKRVEIDVQLTDGSSLPAWVYLARDPDDPLILADCWDPAEFERENLEHFLLDHPDR